MQKLSRSKKNIDIKDIYSFNVMALWKGVRAEHISFTFLLCYYLFEYIRPQSLYPQLDVLPWGQSFMLLTIVAAFFDSSVKWVSNPLNKILFLFCVVIVLSSLLAFKLDESLKYKNVILSWLVVYFLTIRVVNTEKRLILFVIAYLLFNLKMGQHGAFDWISRGFSFASYGLIGAPGWFRNSGEFAIQMIIFGSLAISVVYSLKSYWGKYKKIILLSAAATGYLSVLGASSRGAQLALLVISVFFVLKQKNGFKGLIVITAVFTILYYLIPEEQMARFNEMGDDENSLQRLAYWEAGLEVIAENPFFGIGYYNWMPFMWDRFPNGVGVMETIQVSHNIYIQAGTELGLIGLFIFILLIIYSFINNSRTRAVTKDMENKLYYNLSYGLDAGLLGYLVAGSFVTVLFYPFFWVQIAMIVMLNNVSKKAASSQLSH